MTVLKILYQDEDLVVVSKPEKMLTHRTEIANGDTEFALQLLRDQIGRRVSPVYRLDEALPNPDVRAQQGDSFGTESANS